MKIYFKHCEGLCAILTLLYLWALGSGPDHGHKLVAGCKLLISPKSQLRQSVGKICDLPTQLFKGSNSLTLKFLFTSFPPSLLLSIIAYTFFGPTPNLSFC